MRRSIQLLLQSAESKDAFARLMMDKGKFADAVELFQSAEQCRKDAAVAQDFWENTYPKLFPPS